LIDNEGLNNSKIYAIGN